MSIEQVGDFGWPPAKWGILRWPQVGDFQVAIRAYGILYTEEPEGIFILAVMHLHRNPDYWKHRLDSGVTTEVKQSKLPTEIAS